MERLSLITLLLGGVLTVLYADMVLFPKRAMAWLAKFPRSRAPAIALTALDLAWAGWCLYETPLGPVEKYKPLLWVLVPVACVLVVIFVDELLAPRALGGLLLLAPAPILAVARLHPSVFRYVPIVMAYIMAIKGMMLVLSPYLFRQGAEIIARSARSCRAWGGLGLALGVFLMGLAIFVF